MCHAHLISRSAVHGVQRAGTTVLWCWCASVCWGSVRAMQRGWEWVAVRHMHMMYAIHEVHEMHEVHVVHEGMHACTVESS